MKLLLFLLSTILTITSVNSNNIFSCSNKLERIECLNTDYCGWCNASKLNVTSYGNVCKRITNCNVTHDYGDACEYKNTIQTCKINTTTLYLFLLCGQIGCCYVMVSLIYNLLNIVNYSKSLPLLYFITPTIMLLAVNEQLYLMFIFISIGSYLLIAMSVVWYKHVYL